MQKVAKAALILMTLLTVIYIGGVVFTFGNAEMDDYFGPHSNHTVVYAADKYEGDTPPTNWYTPDQLGIYGVIGCRAGDSWLQIAVDREKELFSLQGKTPVFLYRDEFYQVSPLWASGAASRGSSGWQIPVGGLIGLGWVCTGAILLKWRGKK